MKTADLMDLYQEELQSCEIQFKNYGGHAAFWGPCKTVKCENDNVLLRQMLERPANGHILMVDGGGSLKAALIGDIMAGIGRKNNWAGIVINGAIRDTVAIMQLGLGVKAIGSNPRRCQQNGDGESDAEISFGGITVKPGDWIYCDEDGVVVANRELPLEITQKAQP